MFGVLFSFHPTLIRYFIFERDRNTERVFTESVKAWEEREREKNNKKKKTFEFA